jgi:hypothetical protein
VSSLFRAIKALASQGDRAAIGVVQGLAGQARYRVLIAGTEYETPALSGASAHIGQSVAVLMSGQTGRPIAMLGAVSP